MKNHPIYIKVKAYALANLSYDELDAMTTGEIVKVAGAYNRVSGTFAENLKRGVLEEIAARDDENRLQLLKSNVTVFLDTNFPGWEAERGREQEKPFVKIWMEGKP